MCYKAFKLIYRSDFSRGTTQVSDDFLHLRHHAPTYAPRDSYQIQNQSLDIKTAYREVYKGAEVMATSPFAQQSSFIGICAGRHIIHGQVAKKFFKVIRLMANSGLFSYEDPKHPIHTR